MKNSIVWILLLLLTGITAFISGKQYAIAFILLIADIKLFLIAFQFMELKKAHAFWKASLVILIVSLTLTLYAFTV